MQFRDIIGQEEIKRRLVRSVAENRISHAQLFSGATGRGTLALAIAYAQYINCTNRSETDSCGECPSCRQISGLAHPDVHFVFPVNTARAKSGSERPTSDNFLPQWREAITRTGGYIDEPAWYAELELENKQGLISKNEADEVIRKLSFKAFESEYKIVIIWLPERMRPEAANGLLKILEEPWDKTLFLMVSESPDRLLPTIISRVQGVMVPPIDDLSLAGYLVSQCGAANEEAQVVARLSGGDRTVAVRMVGSGEGDPFFGPFVELMRLSYNDRHMELLEWADRMAALGREEQKQLLVNAVRLLRSSYMMHAGLERIAYLYEEELAFCRKFAPYIGNHNIEPLVAEIELAIRQLGQNGNPKIIFAHFALTVSKMIVRR